MKTIQAIIEDETYKTLLDITRHDKRSLSSWVVLLIEKELKSREAAQAQPNDYGGEHYV